MFSGGIERDQWHEMGGLFYESGQTVEISIKYDNGCFIQVLFQDLESFTLPDVAEIGLTFMIFFSVTFMTLSLLYPLLQKILQKIHLESTFTYSIHLKLLVIRQFNLMHLSYSILTHFFSIFPSDPQLEPKFLDVFRLDHKGTLRRNVFRSKYKPRYSV